jgi:hypothetical protein
MTEPHPLDIAEFLTLSPALRVAAWKRQPPNHFNCVQTRNGAPRPAGETTGIGYQKLIWFDASLNQRANFWAMRRRYPLHSPRARHKTHDLSSALLAAIGPVINLATRNEDAHFHERFASGALRRMGLKARLGFL